MSSNNYRSSYSSPYNNNNVYNTYTQSVYGAYPNAQNLPLNARQMPNQPYYPQMPQNGFMPQQMGQPMPQMGMMQEDMNNMPIKTNKIFVTSLEEALSRSTEYFSETTYYHQDLPIMYEVVVDGKGRKKHRTYDITEKIASQATEKKEENNQEIDLTRYVTTEVFNKHLNDLSEDLDILSERFDKLLEQLKHTSMGKSPVNPTKTAGGQQ